MKKFVIKGDVRSGKTYNARHLISEIKSNKTLVLSTECIKESQSYDAFFNLLDNIFEIDLFNRRERNETINQAIEMVGGFVLGPLASFVSGKAESNFNKEDIFISISKKLKDLLKSNDLILFFDNVDFIDSASEELLEYLIEELKDFNNLVFVFTTISGEKSYLKQAELIEVFSLNKEFQIDFLSNVFHLSNEVVNWIINWLSDNEKVYPALLVDIVKNLYKSNFLVEKNGIYFFSDDFDKNNPAIPDSIKDEAIKILEENSEYYRYFEVASVIGKDFDARMIADILEKSLIDVVSTLDDIAKNTGLIEDKYSKDNFYSFSSQIFLETFRNIFNYSNASSLVPNVSQLMRYYHKYIAHIMIKYDYKYTQIANHFYSAGFSEIKSAIEYQLKAADSSKKMYQFEEAYKYIDKAKELSKYDNEFKDEIEEQELIIKADENFVRGHLDIDFTNRLITKLQEDLDEVSEEFKIVTIRTIYDSGKIDRSYFAKTTEISEKYLIPSENKITKAQGYHFAALGLDNTPENKEKKVQYFDKSLELTKDNKELWAQIANSYAGYLGFGNKEEKEYAKKLYLKSEKIKQNLPFKDLPGLARTYGGLGRLALFDSPCKCEEAIDYLNKDLEVSRDLKDEFGISNMYSLLGMAYRLKKEFKKAIEYYNKSISLKHNPIDVFASVFGKIACGENAYEEAKEYIKEFGNPPSFTYSFLNEEQKEKLELK